MHARRDNDTCGGRPDRGSISLARVVRNESVTPSSYIIELEAPEIARASTPGQFVMLRLLGESAPTLARPFAVFDRAAGADGAPNLTILYQCVGRGTKLMAGLEAGDEVSVWGPLGNGFDLGGEADEWVIVAGGIGAASFGLAAREILAKPSPARVVYLVGARSEKELPAMAPFDDDRVETIAATDDGSAGLHGNVIDLLERFLEEAPEGPRRRFIASGPRKMLARFAELCGDRGLDGQVTTEEFMACGVGACQGCVAKVRDAGAAEGFRYVRVCREGPVFGAGDLIFDSFGYL